MEVDRIGQASSMGRKRRERTKPEEEGEARNGGGNPNPGPRTTRSPAQAEIVPAKHRGVQDREGRRNREDGGVRDGGGERYGEEQAYGASWDTNHALAAPTHAGWALGPSCRG